MPFWRRRRETLNEQLLREAGLDQSSHVGVTVSGDAAAVAGGVAEREAADGGPDVRAPPEPFLWEPRPALRVSQYPASALRATPLPRTDGAVVTVDAGGLTGEAVQFVTLPDGTVLTEEPATDEHVGALADAVERPLAPPCRARCRRQEDDVWAIRAQRLAVRELHASSATPSR